MAKRNADSGRKGPRRSEGGKSSSRRSNSSSRPFKRPEDSADDKTGRSFFRPSRGGKSSNSNERRSRNDNESRDDFRGKRDQSKSDERKSLGRSKTEKDPHARFAKKPFKSSPRRREEEDKGEKRSSSRAFFNPSSSHGTQRNFKSRRPTEESTLPKDAAVIRLNKYISNSGVCSRREADEYIKMGLVSVNGNVITELGYKVNRTDEVRFEDKILKAEKPVYVLMNKPKGFITTTKDPEDRKTVMHIIGDAVKERIYPVGRLDRNTTGLLLLTNDGDLADKLMHPSHNAKKIYKVELDRALTKADFQKIIDGVHLEEGRAIVDDLAIISDDKKTVGIEIHIGWNRVVRRIFESLQYTVEKLDRTVYAGLDKKDLPRGSWRFLTKDEVVLLKHYK